MNKKYIVGIIALIVGLVVGYSLQNREAGRQSVGNIDRNFIEQMIPHHEGAIEMAKIALQNAKRPEMKKMATDIIEAQQQEIVQMRSWYSDWFGTEVPVTSAHMMGGNAVHMNSMSGDLEALKKAKDFDLEFIQQMIPHHEMAVMMAQMLLASTSRQEMKTLANNIIRSQTKEIEMMREWATAWDK